MTERVLLTGITGFIFTNFIRYVAHTNEAGYEWISVDNYCLPMSINNRYVNKGLKNAQYIADISRDIEVIDTIFRVERPDIVIHGAAQTSVDKSLKEPDLFHKTNVIGTKILLDASRKYGVKKFLFISTDEVMGSLNSENDPSWTETSPINPRNPYSQSKAEAEKLVMASELNYNITRSANNYGERQSTDKLIPHTIKCILDGKKIPVYGQGNQIRDWLHVQDNCRGILTVLKKGLPNEIYNIGANCEMSNIEMVQKICKILGKGYDLIEHIPDPRGDAHDFRYSMDCSKLKALGWEKQFKLMDGLEQTCDWYVRNKWALK
jgi:dTDP-glucose 4,6-dehydratase